MRFSLKTEDESTKNQRLLEEKIQIKKQQIRAEFEAFDHEQDIQLLTENELKFKHELDHLKTQKKAKIEKLNQLSSMIPVKSESLSEIITMDQSKLNSLEQNQQNLRDKKECFEIELQRVARLIESNILNENSIKNKIEEFIKEINFLKTKNLELKYLCQLAENRFKSLDVIKFNAQNKEVFY
jgi:hypothetical protein